MDVFARNASVMGDVGMEEEMGQADPLDQGMALLDEQSREHVAADVLQRECQETLDAVHHSCMFVQDEVVEELQKKGQKTEFDEEVVAQVAYTVCDTLCNTWPGELLQFAKHGKRSVINVSDLRLLFRRNKSMLSFIEKIAESSLHSARQRKSRKGSSKTNETNNTENMDGESSRDAKSFLPESKNILKLTDFWDQPSTSGTLPLTPLQMPSECASEMEQKSPSNMTLSFKRAITSGTSVPHSKQTKLVESTVGKAVNCRKKRLRQTKQSSVVPVSESLTKLESGFMDVDTPTSSNQLWDEDLQKRKRTSVTKSIILTSDVSSCSKCEQNEMKTLKDSTTAFMKENGEVLVIHPAAISSTGKKLNVQADDKAGFAELEIEKMPCGNLTLPIKLPISNPEKMGFGKQVPFMPSRKRSTAADDCFSIFTFESDDEESSQPCLLIGNKETVDKTGAESWPAQDFGRRSETSNIVVENQQNTDGNETDADLDATIFDF